MLNHYRLFVQGKFSTKYSNMLDKVLYMNNLIDETYFISYDYYDKLKRVGNTKIVRALLS